MRMRRGAAGLLLLLALALNVAPAQGEIEARPATTAFTCKKKVVEGGPGFSKSHCKAADAVGSGAGYEHVAIPANTRTEITVSNENTEGKTQVAKLRSTIAGVNLELQATGTHAEGWMENKIDTRLIPTTKPKVDTHIPEPVFTGEAQTTYSGVTVTAPAGKGCKVKGEKIVTNKLRATSRESGMEGKLEPAEGETFFTFEIEGCSIAALNNGYSVTGSVKCPVDGATAVCTHTATTAQGTLKMLGQKAGVEVTTTFKGKDAAAGDSGYTPISPTTEEFLVTTTETP